MKWCDTSSVVEHSETVLLGLDFLLILFYVGSHHSILPGSQENLCFPCWQTEAQRKNGFIWFFVTPIVAWKHNLPLDSMKYSSYPALHKVWVNLIVASPTIQKYITLATAMLQAASYILDTMRYISLFSVIRDFHWSVYTWTKLVWEINIRSLWQKVSISSLTFKTQL